MSGKDVWITRPQGQAGKLLHALQETGANGRHIPLLAIVRKALDSDNKKIIMNLDNYDLVFYISSNAARIGLDVISDFWPQYPQGIINFSVGPTTAAVLSEAGLSVLYPAIGMSTEALLAMPELAKINGKKALIIKGDGGRELLAQALESKGAEVTELALYRRQCPDYDVAELCANFQKKPPDFVVISSSEALDNFISLFRSTGDSMLNVGLLVTSDRIASRAGEFGFKQVHVLPGATDSAIMEPIGK